MPAKVKQLQYNPVIAQVRQVCLAGQITDVQPHREWAYATVGFISATWLQCTAVAQQLQGVLQLLLQLEASLRSEVYVARYTFHADVALLGWWWEHSIKCVDAFKGM